MGDFYGTGIKIWAGFGPVGITGKRVRPRLGVFLYKNSNDHDHYYVEFLTIQVQEQSVYQVDIDMLKLLQKGRCFESNSTIPRFDYCFLTFQ